MTKLLRVTVAGALFGALAVPLSATASATYSTPTVAQAKNFAATERVPLLKKDLKAKGVSAFGRPKIECARTDASAGSPLECLTKLTYIRLDSCGMVEVDEFVTVRNSRIGDDRRRKIRSQSRSLICMFKLNGDDKPPTAA